jgi:predicted transport protein
VVSRWRCPDCEREFGRTNQGHECAPALSLDEYFATGPAHERPIFEVVRAHVETLGDDVHIEPVQVGVFFKRERTFAELRPRDRWVALSFGLRHQVTHPTITRKVVEHAGRFHHVANLREPGDYDDRLRGWVAEAYED